MTRGKCRQAEQWMDAALDEGGVGLPPQRRAELEHHLHACPGCRSQWEVLRQAESLLRVPRPAAAPDGMLLEFRRRLAAEPVRAPRPSFWTWILPVGSLAAAGAAAALIMATGVHLTPPPSTPARPLLPYGTPRPQAKEPHATVGERSAEKAPTPGPVPVAKARPRVANAKTPAPPARPDVPLSKMAKADTPAARPFEAQTFGYRDGRTAEPERIEERLSLGKPSVLAAASSGGRAPATAAPVDTYTPDSPELNVSPAVLTALNRTVEVSARSVPVQEVAQQLALEADVQLQVDPSAAQLRVSVAQDPAPLWKTLESVAKQSRLQIVPVDNRLVLKLAAAPDHSKDAAKLRLEAVTRKASTGVVAKAIPELQERHPKPEELGLARKSADVRATAKQELPPMGLQGGFGGAAVPGAAPGAAAAAASKSAPAPAAPAGPRGLDRNATGREAGAHPAPPAAPVARALATSALAEQPDRTVWPAAWGTLPERGFTPIAPEELGPQQKPAPEAGRANTLQQNNVRLRGNRLQNGR